MGFDHILNQQEKSELLRIARITLAAYLDTGTLPAEKPRVEQLQENGAAFVTLKTKTGTLRGCIGTFSAATPLYKTIQEMAISAATRPSTANRSQLSAWSLPVAST